MQERQVTSGNTTHPLPDPFQVFATRNPIEQEGTYPLPEAQLDRFLLEVHIGYPSAKKSANRASHHPRGRWRRSRAALTGDELRALQLLVPAWPAPTPRSKRRCGSRGRHAPRKPGAVSIVSRYVRFGAGPRGSQALVLAAKARAALRGEAAQRSTTCAPWRCRSCATAWSSPTGPSRRRSATWTSSRGRRLLRLRVAPGRWVVHVRRHRHRPPEKRRSSSRSRTAGLRSPAPRSWPKLVAPARAIARARRSPRRRALPGRAGRRAGDAAHRANEPAYGRRLNSRRGRRRLGCRRAGESRARAETPQRAGLVWNNRTTEDEPAARTRPLHARDSIAGAFERCTPRITSSSQPPRPEDRALRLRLTSSARTRCRASTDGDNADAGTHRADVVPGVRGRTSAHPRMHPSAVEVVARSVRAKVAVDRRIDPNRVAYARRH